MDSAQVQCPYCLETVELLIDPETKGSYVEDCEVCCRPWQVTVSRRPQGVRVRVDRAQ
ncbi:MAG: CPXCG motif-containing cysteine-rich protein [Myxococcales bacterium]|nr:CPXCG motif-containing cysteine-rich protein [Myxococcales bacterium]